MNAEQLRALGVIGRELRDLPTQERSRVVAAIVVGFGLEKDLVNILAHGKQVTRDARLVGASDKPQKKS